MIQYMLLSRWVIKDINRLNVTKGMPELNF
jgi:hypothetical protein